MRFPIRPATMLVDSRRLAPATVLEGDVCVVGAGAAGITLARRLADSGHTVVLLESGGLAYDQEVQRLYEGEATGPLIEPGAHYLGSTRLRYFGGTTNHWNGWCRPLDPIDFEARDWVPDSGWPLGVAELEPYYARAVRWVEISPFDAAPGEWEADERPYLFRAGDAFETSYFHLSPPTRFGPKHRQEIEGSERVRLCLNASLVGLEINEAASHVAAAEAATLDGARFRVRARHYVLAAGTIENARLLLAANDRVEAGLGNAHDLVGRYFQEHPFVRAGYFVLPAWAGRMRAYDRAHGIRGVRNKVRGVVVAGEELQRRHRLLNALAVIDSLKKWERPELAPEVAELAAATARLGAAEAETPEEAAPYFGSLTLALEQAPSPASRVLLDAERDALGMPRSRLEWRLSPLDEASVQRTAELLALEIGRRGGRVRLDVEPATPWPGGRGSPHQMGTTRMDPDPRRGVVDVDARVHGTANLYVAGGSVFPTGGCSNPTLTIVALTLRLADHLNRRLAA